MIWITKCLIKISIFPFVFDCDFEGIENTKGTIAPRTHQNQSPCYFRSQAIGFRYAKTCL